MKTPKMIEKKLDSSTNELKRMKVSNIFPKTALNGKKHVVEK